MKYLICIGHPSQFHLFKNIISELEKKGHSIRVLTTNKDLLEDLFISSGIPFENILPRRKSGSLYHLATNFVERFWIIARIARNYKPNLLLGSEVTLPLVGKALGIPSIIFSEDDAKIIPQFARAAYPYASVILSPQSCNVGKWEYKKIGYNGFQKLAYLHPNRFNPKSININNTAEKYFVLRFVQLSAYHDKDRQGISAQVARKIIDILSPYGRIYISSERTLEPEFEPYRINMNPSEIHSLLFNAHIYIGDSQSMAVESAVLGIPGIRFSDFSGEISVLEELEHRYGLTKGLKSTQIEELLSLVNEYARNKEIKQEFQQKRKKLLDEKIDVAAFMVWFIENYPDSVTIMKENPDYQMRFM